MSALFAVSLVVVGCLLLTAEDALVQVLGLLLIAAGAAHIYEEEKS